jgi:surface polysaccharide O-acyltransferase-like enzyme
VADILVYVRLPLFAFLAGYVYGLRPVSEFDAAFILKKARRLLLPMAVVAAFFVVLQNAVPGTHAKHELTIDLIVYPVGGYWFIESLFIIFVATAALEQFGALKTPAGFIVALACMTALQLGASVPSYFSLSGAVYLFPYFLCGLACNRFQIDSRGAAHLALTAAVAGAMYLAVCLAQDSPLPARISATAFLIGTGVSFLLLRQTWHPQVMLRIGQSAYAIFLFHPFFTSSVRIFSYKLGFIEKNTLVIVATLSGIVGPLLLEALIRKTSVTAFLLMGDPWPESKEEVQTGDAPETGSNAITAG